MSEPKRSGFLGNDFQSHYTEIRKKYHDLYKFVNRINNIYHKIDYADLSVKMQDDIVGCLFLRILETYQAIIKLSKLGMLSQCNMLCRCLLEPSLVFIKCIENPKFIEIFKDSYKNDLLISIERMKIQKVLFPEWENILEENKEMLKKEINNNPDLRIGFKSICKKDNEPIESSELYKRYLSRYLLWNKAVHSSVDNIKNTYINANEKGFASGPKIDEIPIVLIGASDIALDVLWIIESKTKHNIKNDLDRIEKDYKHLHERYFPS